MTAVEFFGCAFISFGPPFVLFCITIAKDPIKIIILIASAFFWLISLLLSSLLWKLLSFGLDESLLMVSVCCSVFLQELLRFIIYILLRKAESGLELVTEDGHELLENKHILAYVSGLGFGIMSGVFALANVLADSLGPGTVALNSGGTPSTLFFVISSLYSLVFIIYHIGWSLIFFHGLNNKNYFLVALVPTSHLIASLLTFFNRQGHYLPSIVTNFGLCFLTSILAFYISGGRFRQKSDESNLSNDQEHQVPTSQIDHEEIEGSADGLRVRTQIPNSLNHQVNNSIPA